MSVDRTISMSRRRFRALLTELARRGDGTRESGAFLLGRASHANNQDRRITGVAYYDDLDAECLTGGVTFRGFPALWALCERTGSTVVADIHTHPGTWTQQSSIDASNPMVSSIGHIALIAPNYAHGVRSVQDLGVHVHQGGFIWKADQPGEPSSVVLRNGLHAVLLRLTGPRKKAEDG
jgi:proteasome lid subunit RPN8/RPN11